MKCWYTVGKNGIFLKNYRYIYHNSIFKYSIFRTQEMNATMVALFIKIKLKKNRKKLRKSRVRKFNIEFSHSILLLNFLIFFKRSKRWNFPKKSSVILNPIFIHSTYLLFYGQYLSYLLVFSQQ